MAWFGSSSSSSSAATATSSLSFGSLPSPHLSRSSTTPSTAFSFPSSTTDPNSSSSSSVPLFSFPFSSITSSATTTTLSAPTTSVSGFAGSSSSSTAASMFGESLFGSTASSASTANTPSAGSSGSGLFGAGLSTSSPLFGGTTLTLGTSSASSNIFGTPTPSSSSNNSRITTTPLFDFPWVAGTTTGASTGLYADDMDTAPAGPSIDAVQAGVVAPLSTHTLPPTESHHTHPFPPGEVSQQNNLESRNIAEGPSMGTVTFRGYTVPSYLLHPLKQLQEIEGDFWSESVCLDTEATNYMMALLGKAARLLDRTWGSLSKVELKFLISSVNAGRDFNFGLDKMKLIADEAQRILDCNDLVERRERIRAELREVELEIEQRFGSRDLDLAVKSFVKP